MKIKERKKLNIKMMCMTSLFVVLMIVGAYIKIPTPIPFTLQVFFCLLAGIVLGKFYGTLSQVVYLSLGLVGLPVFAGGGGLGYIFTPTFGFILGFIPAAFAVGCLNQYVAKFNLYKLILSGIVGVIIIYIIGAAYCYVIYNFYLGEVKNLYEILMLTVVPFILIDFVKAVLAAFIGKTLHKNTKLII